MKNNIIKIALIVGYLCFIVACRNDAEIRYVDIAKVVDNFKLKKELESKLVKIREGRAQQIDSMELKLKILSREIQAGGKKDLSLISEFEIRKSEYVNKKQRFTSEVDSFASVYDSQIATQINQYVKDFGIEKKYQFLFGADGSGVLMYADSTKDVTAEFISFIDLKYSGK